MPYVYVYSPGDFTAEPPHENVKAVGNTPFTLTLNAGAKPTLVEINDDDLLFNEVDAGQTLNHEVNLDGTIYTAGTTIHTAYDLNNSTNGHRVSAIHFGGDGNQGGPVHGIVSTIFLNPGQSYSFDLNDSSRHHNNNLYTNYVSCFVSGTLIETVNGPVPVEILKAGDLILTSDKGMQPLKLRLHRHVTSEELERNPKLCPVVISAGALGAGLPLRNLHVSPQHRMVVSSPIARRMFGEGEVLVSARNLTALPGIFEDERLRGVTYYHLVMEEHEIIFAEGAPTESFYLGVNALRTLEPAAMEEMEALFPDMLDFDIAPPSALPIPAGRHQRQLVARHIKNIRPILG